MKFPSIRDITTISVITLNIDDTLAHALEVMIEFGHRSLVVLDGKKFRLLNVMDIIKREEERIDLQVTLKSMNLTKVPTIDKYKNVLDSLEYINDLSQHICVVNEDGSLYGIVSHTDIIANIDPDTLMDNYRLEDFLKIGRRVRTVSNDEITADVLRNMQMIPLIM